MKLIAAAAFVALLLHQSGAPQAATAPVPYSYQGTVRAVQAQAPSLDVVTAVGMAFRLVHITVVPATRIETEGAALALRDLRAGDIVRADCHLTAKGLVADKIEKLRVP